jgi:hypothetical protein
MLQTVGDMEDRVLLEKHLAEQRRDRSEKHEQTYEEILLDVSESETNDPIQ